MPCAIIGIVAAVGFVVCPKWHSDVWSTQECPLPLSYLANFGPSPLKRIPGSTGDPWTEPDLTLTFTSKIKLLTGSCDLVQIASLPVAVFATSYVLSH